MDRRPATTVLIADGEELVRNMIAIIVRQSGHDVLVASDGYEALDLSRRYAGHIDLLISDIMMPRISGIKLAHLLAEERPAIKVLLVSGTSEVAVPPQFPLLRKPFTAPALSQAVTNLIAPTNPG